MISDYKTEGFYCSPMFHGAPFLVSIKIFTSRIPSATIEIKMTKSFAWHGKHSNSLCEQGEVKQLAVTDEV